MKTTLFKQKSNKLQESLTIIPGGWYLNLNKPTINEANCWEKKNEAKRSTDDFQTLLATGI